MDSEGICVVCRNQKPVIVPLAEKKGVVVGAYDTCFVGQYKLTPTGLKLNTESGDRIMKYLKGSNLDKNGALLISDICPDFHAVAVCGLGSEDAGCNDAECLDECKENIRVAAGNGARALQDNDVNIIYVEGFSNVKSAAEGAVLATWKYQELKDKADQVPLPELEIYEDPDCEGWRAGIDMAESQNLSRKLEEIPANIMTPANFAKTALSTLCPCGVHVDVRDKAWMDKKKMCGFLSMSQGSCEAPLILEMSYCGGREGDKPVVLIGSGITFDSGGLNLKEFNKMVNTRSLGMAGAAVVIGVLRGLATMKIPINVNAVIPLCENMPGGMATKPGDVVMSHCGKTILVERTNNAAQVILADILSFSAEYNPCLVINTATFNYSLKNMLGSPASAVFSSSSLIWMEIVRAAADTGDRVWRLPLWKAYSNYVTKHKSVDVTNVGVYPGGDPCTTAAFLKEFAPCSDFVHVDITGTGGTYYDDCCPYLRRGLMTGRPTRTIIQLLYQMVCPDKPPCCE